MRIRALPFLVALAGAFASAHAQESAPASIAVFPFELEDRSAGAGLIPPDEYDRRYLSEATLVAKRMLAQSGRFAVIEVQAGKGQSALPDELRHCGGCEARIAQEQGASFALLGVVTRVNRTEHTMFIRILDARTGQPVSAGFTDLRMGANHAWPRSAKWLMDRKILQ